MLPVHSILLTEKATIAMYHGIAKHPIIGRLSCLVVGAAAALSPLLQSLATTVESLALVLIHLIGSMFPNLECTPALAGTCFALFLINSIRLILSPLEGIERGICVLFETLMHPKEYACIQGNKHQHLYNDWKDTKTLSQYWTMVVHRRLNEDQPT